jgi:malate dehydrogenase (oxaloacetate-decarboxylating)(NADP+)
MGLRIDCAQSVRILDPALDAALFEPLVADYQRLVGRRGVPPDAAAIRVRNRPTVAACLLLHGGHADAAICGGTGNWWQHMLYVMPIIPRRPDVSRIFALSCLILQAGAVFIGDTYMNVDPSAEEIAEMTLLAADAVRGFGLAPKAAMLSHSSFGSSNSPSARKMRQALQLVRMRAPGLEVDGEMHADAALAEAIRQRAVPDSRLSGTANLLIMPSLDAANIAFNLLKAAADGLPVGPLLLGMSKPVHVVVPSVTARGIVNISAIAATEAVLAADGAPAAQKGGVLARLEHG